MVVLLFGGIGGLCVGCASFCLVWLVFNSVGLYISFVLLCLCAAMVCWFTCISWSLWCGLYVWAVVSWLCSLFMIWLRLDLFGELGFGWLMILVDVLSAAGGCFSLFVCCWCRVWCDGCLLILDCVTIS